MRCGGFKPKEYWHRRACRSGNQRFWRKTGGPRCRYFNCQRATERRRRFKSGFITLNNIGNRWLADQGDVTNNHRKVVHLDRQLWVNLNFSPSILFESVTTNQLTLNFGPESFKLHCECVWGLEAPTSSYYEHPDSTNQQAEQRRKRNIIVSTKVFGTNMQLTYYNSQILSKNHCRQCVLQTHFQYGPAPTVAKCIRLWCSWSYHRFVESSS